MSEKQIKQRNEPWWRKLIPDWFVFWVNKGKTHHIEPNGKTTDLKWGDILLRDIPLIQDEYVSMAGYYDKMDFEVNIAIGKGRLMSILWDD